MSDTVLQTKLYIPPTRPSLVPRPRLTAKLNTGLWQGNGFARKLTLVSAPAGFGKTTLVVDWIRTSQFKAQNTQFSWLSLDSYDSDPNRFWQYVMAALNTAVPDIGVATQLLLSASPPPPPPALLTGLLNELACLDYPLVLALDDYHLIGDPMIHEGLDFLLEHAPPQLHLVLITRADPPLALARLRGRGLLSEIRADDLRFTPAETTVFLREVMGLALSSGDVAALETRTEGWITGLHMTAVSLQGRSDKSSFIKDFSGSHHYILEYLTEEVLQQQPAKVQSFLLKTSILSRLSGPLCDAVTGRKDSQTMLAQLQQQNLFITPLDGERNWFRTHHLLADMLHNCLRQTAAPDEIEVLHRRASAWCAAHGAWETAVSHAFAGGDLEHAADLVATAYHPLTALGHVATWQQWLQQIPESLVQARPALLMRRGWAAFLKGELQQAETMLVSARKSLLDDAPSPERQILRGELATYLATIAFLREDPDRVIEAAEEALACLPLEASTARARATSALGMGASLSGATHRAMRLFHETVALARQAGNPFFLAHGLELVADGQYHTGQLRAAAATCREIIALGREGRAAPLPFAGNGHLKLASIYVEWRELARAEEEMATGLTLNRQGGLGYNSLPDLCTQVRLRHALGDEGGALTALRRAEAVFRQNPSGFMAVQLAACAVQFWLHAGDLATAVSWAEGRALPGMLPAGPGSPIIKREVQQVSLARVRLAQGRPDEVLAIYNPLYPRSYADGRIARCIEIGLLAALAYQLRGESGVALDTLRQILALARTEGYVQIFVECGAPMHRLLRRLPAQTDYVQMLERAFPAALRTPAVPPVAPLSRRELEVLQLIAAGLSNKQIAAKLTVTLNTVKKHTSHIYAKLEVNGRTQAAARARELNLLTDRPNRP